MEDVAMSGLWYRLKTEPVLVGSLIEALIALALAFGLVDWSAEQVAGVMAVVAILTGAAVRTQTNSREFVENNLRDAEQAIEQARADGVL